MKNLKKKEGITLVALIITIVVLLILAAVAIGAAKDSSIIGYAQNAAGSFNQAKTNETGDLTRYEETINKYVPKKELSAEEKDGIAELFIQYFINRDEETKKILLDKGVDLNSAIEFYNEDGVYFYIKDNLDILILAGEDENRQPVCSIVDTNTIPILSDLYEIAVIANQDVKTKTSDKDDFTIKYKGETINGQWNASPWNFEYKGCVIICTDDSNYGEGTIEDLNYSMIKYVGV